VTELWVTLGGRFPLIRAREGALAPAHSHMRVQETKAAQDGRKVTPTLWARYLVGREGPEMAPSVTAWAHTAFPKLRADRPYHRPDDDSRP
jgi:hypothetical protein